MERCICWLFSCHIPFSIIEFPFHLEKNLNFQRYNFLIGILDVCRIPRIYLNAKINVITSLRLLFYNESMRESSPYLKYSMREGLVGGVFWIKFLYFYFFFIFLIFFLSGLPYHLDNTRNCVRKICLLWGVKGILLLMVHEKLTTGDSIFVHSEGRKLKFVHITEKIESLKI